MLNQRSQEEGPAAADKEVQRFHISTLGENAAPSNKRAQFALAPCALTKALKPSDWWACQRVRPAGLSLVLMMFLGLAFAPSVWAQSPPLTPGAAAVGGAGGQLIPPPGQASPQPTRPRVGSSGRRVHYPNPNWEIVLPPQRTLVNGQLIGSTDGSDAVAAAQSATPEENAGLTPLFTPDPDAATGPQASVSPSSPAAGTDLPSAAPAGNDGPNAPNSLASNTSNASANPSTPGSSPATDPASDPTQQVTAGAALPGADPFDDPNISPPLLSDFDRAELNFGAANVDLTTQHEIALGPVVALMQTQPDAPLRVVAVLAQADASNEDAKSLARRRILAVRRYLIEQGLSADNLTFVISANSSTESFANYVLIES